jgi:hypothetical protein
MFSFSPNEDDEINLWSIVSFVSGQRPDTQRALAILLWEMGGQNRRKVWAAFEVWAAVMKRRFESSPGEAVISETVKFVFQQISDKHKLEAE